ncbi:MAG: hypothetical protein ABL903_02030 [Methylococcales bacterium]
MSELGIIAPRSIIHKLWEKSAEHFSDEELEWLSGASEVAERELVNLSSTLESIDCLVNSDEDTGTYNDNGNVSTLLFSIVSQIEYITGLLHVGGEAEWRLNHPELKLLANPNYIQS